MHGSMMIQPFEAGLGSRVGYCIRHRQIYAAYSQSTLSQTSLDAQYKWGKFQIQPAVPADQAEMYFAGLDAASRQRPVPADLCGHQRLKRSPCQGKGRNDMSLPVRLFPDKFEPIIMQCRTFDSRVTDDRRRSDICDCRVPMKRVSPPRGRPTRGQRKKPGP